MSAGAYLAIGRTNGITHDDLPCQGKQGQAMMTASQQPALRGELRFDEPLSRYNTWRVGGVAQRLYLPADVSDLVTFLGTLPPREPLLPAVVARIEAARGGGA